MAKPIRVRCTRLNPRQPGQKSNVLRCQACFCSCASRAGAGGTLSPVAIDFYCPVRFRPKADIRNVGLANDAEAAMSLAPGLNHADRIGLDDWVVQLPNPTGATNLIGGSSLAQEVCSVMKHAFV